MSKLPAALQKLTMQLRKLPGVGSKTAERYAFQLLEWEPASLDLLAKTLQTLSKEIYPCPTCHCLKGLENCEFCDPEKREPTSLCIVSHSKDVYPIEETRTFKGLYHVLGSLFSPIHGHGRELINLEKLENQIKKNGVKDVILALDSTVEGDATALFLKEEMKTWNVSISRLAFGMPLGSSFDYVDPGTLARALLGRQHF